MLWIRIPILEIFIVPETAQRHHSSPTYYTSKVYAYLNLLHFFFSTYCKTKFVVGDLRRSVQTWFISWPQLSVIRQAYRNLSPVGLAGPGTWGSSNSQQSKPLSSAAVLHVFVKLSPPKAWCLLRWWVFAFMFQRTHRCNFCEGRRCLEALVQAQPHQCLWVLSCPGDPGCPSSSASPCCDPTCCPSLKGSSEFLFKINFD